MAGPDAVCPVHGLFKFENFLGGDGGGAATFTFANCSTNCPQCGRQSPIIDGAYDFVGDVLKAFRAPGVTRENIEDFGTLVKDVQDGNITEQQARDDAAKFGASFVSLLDVANKNAGLITILLTIIGLFIAGYAAYSSDQSSAQSHADSIRVHEDDQQLIEIGKKIYEALQKPQLSDEMQAALSSPKQEMRQISPQQKPKAGAHGNRHERRKAVCLAKRQPRR